MIAFKELENKVHRGVECTGFTYTVKNEKKNPMFEVKFSKLRTGTAEWRMRVIFDRTNDADSQIYNIDYVMPQNDPPLTLVAATGLRYFQYYLKEEIQEKVKFDFALGEILAGL